MAREPLTGQIITAGTPSTDPEVVKLKARLAELEAMTKPTPTALSITVTDDHAVQIYGLNRSRWPVRCHRDALEALFAHAETIQAFMAAHKAELPTLAEWLGSSEYLQQKAAKAAKAAAK